ncbi:HNH endonuclease signature motif containing protein, partial [Arthrobacter sp. YAF34]|uniref:HNH endonuclease signature motif containing protein n=1 Tax=Arthrobacter sp. YAF34 TaxID=3233083 RepID=UPI003F8F88F6
IGRTRYRLTTALRQWLRLRDGRCPFPGCNNPSLDNDADHLLAWADGGTTGITNLAQPCRKHHRLKHSSAWTPTGASKNHPPGWISPSGRHYRSEHQDWEPPHWPDLLTEPDTDPDPGRPADPGHDGEPEPPPADPGPHPDLPLPPDPFPNWHHFTAGHPFPAADAGGPDGLAALDTSLEECPLQPV